MCKKMYNLDENGAKFELTKLYEKVTGQLYLKGFLDLRYDKTPVG